MSPKAARNLFLFLLGFLSIGAIGGGLALIISPSGDLLQLPVSAFKNMPFDDFLIPGIVLVGVLGLMPLVLIWALLKKPSSPLPEKLNVFSDMHWSWTFSIYLSFALIGWIQIQLIFLQDAVYWLHTFYVFYALVMTSVALLPGMREHYRK